MRVVTALMVDEIRDREDGSVDLIGLREDLYFDAVPVILERLTLFVELEVAPNDRGIRHTLELRLHDSAGKQISGVPIRFTLPLDYPRPTAPLDPTLFEIPFDQFGLHYLDLLVGGTISRRLYLSVQPRDQD